ncbi:sigma-70 family RNA polymerase sigma factor [Kitasatospora azatica]|uniref:sigma-70 family RNA polymerase sigma factor n=1 Tax=Kitasatospora azatica TaxID=58347 RepID=UPI0018DD7866|nr:sigma-70 family RNA polymerase sigma factor [Kitasatospora azatica]
MIHPSNRRTPGRRLVPASGREAAVPGQRQGPSVVVLVARAQAGDREAFGRLYQQYTPVVRRYLSRKVADAAAVEDLTSETFLRALRRIDSFSWQGRDFGAWLVTIARNLLIDHLRSTQKGREVLFPAIENGPSLPGVEDLVVARLLLAKALDALVLLTPPQRECVALRACLGYSTAETAAIMGRSRGAVKTLNYRAVKALTAILVCEEQG